MSDPKLARPSWRGRTNVDALTIACIERAEVFGGHEFVVTQGSYQSGGGDVNSAGTHDLGGVVDLRWCGHDACIRALRAAGMAAWHRNPAQGPWPHHIHAVVVGHPRLALSADRQVVAYLTGRDGLKVNGPDDGPKLDPIPEPLWPWPIVEPDPKDVLRDTVRKHLNAAQAEVKAAEAALKRPGAPRLPRLLFQVERGRKAISKARRILRGAR